ncbi:MAG: cytidine deaminase [bacterium]
MKQEIIDKLYNRARAVRQKAYAPYSKFKVGAALITDTKEIFAGCNIENSSLGLTICAERTAVFKAVSAGCNNFQAMLVLSDHQPPVTPCGACRQVLAEFSQDMEIILANLKGERKTMNLAQLFPFPFEGGN